MTDELMEYLYELLSQDPAYLDWLDSLETEDEREDPEVSD
jgi:hypothetical protein